MVSQYRWDKSKRLILKLAEMEVKRKEGMDRDNMESIRGFLVYVNKTYQEMKMYLKILNLTLDSWRPF